MKLNKQVEIAIDIYKLLQANPNTVLKCEAIAYYTGHSKRWVDKITCHLRKAGILASVRGQGGGYQFINPNYDYKVTLMDIFTALKINLHKDKYTAKLFLPVIQNTPVEAV